MARSLRTNGQAALRQCRPENQSFVVVLKSKKPLELKQFLKDVPAVMKEKNGKNYAEIAAQVPMVASSRFLVSRSEDDHLRDDQRTARNDR